MKHNLVGKTLHLHPKCWVRVMEKGKWGTPLIFLKKILQSLFQATECVFFAKREMPVNEKC